MIIQFLIIYFVFHWLYNTESIMRHCRARKKMFEELNLSELTRQHCFSYLIFRNLFFVMTKVVISCHELSISGKAISKSAFVLLITYLIE